MATTFVWERDTPAPVTEYDSGRAAWDHYRLCTARLFDTPVPDTELERARAALAAAEHDARTNPGQETRDAVAQRQSDLEALTVQAAQAWERYTYRKALLMTQSRYLSVACAVEKDLRLLTDHDVAVLVPDLYAAAQQYTNAIRVVESSVVQFRKEIEALKQNAEQLGRP